MKVWVTQSCLFTTLWTAAGQAPLPTGFSRQEYWRGLRLSPKTPIHHGTGNQSRYIFTRREVSSTAITMSLSCFKSFQKVCNVHRIKKQKQTKKPTTMEYNYGLFITCKPTHHKNMFSSHTAYVLVQSFPRFTRQLSLDTKDRVEFKGIPYWGPLQVFNLLPCTIQLPGFPMNTSADQPLQTLPPL